MRFNSTITIAAGLLLSACSLVSVDNGTTDDAGSSASSQEASIRETNNVTYTGVVQPAGISIYQQGSHRLVLAGGKFILLESDDVDLNGYVGEEVQAFGALRPTVEAGGMIMRVERVELMQVSSISSSLESTSSNASFSSSATSSRSVMQEESSASIQSSSQATTSSAESIASEFSSFSKQSSAADTSSSQESSSRDAAYTERVDVMSRQEYEEASWTQQYCTSHIGFCIPVHRNWWFKSFGATSSTLWHVEFSSEPIDSIGQGPIVLQLLAGSAGDASGTVDVSGSTAVAYKEWTFGRHFRIAGDASLSGPIRYLMEHITEYVE